MSNLAQQWIEVFRAGDYGDKGNYSTSDLDQIVANYDPAQHEAPVVLGHPENDAPAYAWVDALRRVGDVLQAKFGQVSDALEEAVKSGAYKKRSIALYSQPKLMLRHVGFLGATPPHVKGLADAKFSAGEFRAIEFKEEEEVANENDNKTFLESLRAFFAEKIGEMKSAISEAQKQPPAATQFSEADVKAKVDKAVSEATATFKQQFDDLSKKFNESQTASQTASISQRAKDAIAKLKGNKKWIPAFDKMGVPELFGELAKLDVTVEFGEGDKKVKKSPVEIFADFMGGLPEIVPTEKMIAAGATSQHKGTLVQFTESDRVKADPNSVLFAEACQKYADEHKVPFAQAMVKLAATWTPAAGGAAAGQV